MSKAIEKQIWKRHSTTYHIISSAFLPWAVALLFIICNMVAKTLYRLDCLAVPVPLQVRKRSSAFLPSVRHPSDPMTQNKAQDWRPLDTHNARFDACNKSPSMVKCTTFEIACVEIHNDWRMQTNLRWWSSTHILKSLAYKYTILGAWTKYQIMEKYTTFISIRWWSSTHSSKTPIMVRYTAKFDAA